MSERPTLCIRDRHGFERSLPLDRTLILGRQSQSDVVLPDNMVSRSHLRIEFCEGAWWVEDLNSAHGTFIKDRRIERLRWEPGTPLRLADGAYELSLHTEPQDSETSLRAILRTSQLLAGEVELEELLEQSMERLLTLSGTERGFIMLPEGGDLVVKIQRGLGPEIERVIEISMSSVRRVYEQRETIWIHNLSSSDRLQVQKTVLDLQLKTICCLPLLVHGNCIGVVYLDSQKRVMEPVDRRTFEAIVSLCAIAIERTRLTEENLRNQVLATVGQVTSTIVHDFKNALFVVSGHAQMLQSRESDPASRRHVEQILEAADRLTAMSLDVLDFTKVREPRRQSIDLASYLGTLLEPMAHRAREAGVQLQVEGPSCSVSLDPNRFTRVLENLIANSLDALKGRPEGRIRVTWEQGDSETRIRVQDNGKGIPPKILKRIFEPFFSHGKQKGTGLGMATVKKIMEEHNGRVQVQSEEGVGTSVLLSLPDRVQTGSLDPTRLDPLFPP